MASMHSIRVHAPVSGVAPEPDRDLGQISLDLDEAHLRAAFDAGRAAGIAEETESGRAALELAAERLDQARDAAENAIPGQIVDLAVAIARELLAVELHAGNYDLERLIRSTLASSGVGRGECTVHVSRQDAERLEAIPFRSGTHIEADPSLSPGDIQVTTPRGLLVREMEPCLEAIREQLLEDLAL